MYTFFVQFILKLKSHAASQEDGDGRGGHFVSLFSALPADCVLNYFPAGNPIASLITL